MNLSAWYTIQKYSTAPYRRRKLLLWYGVLVEGEVVEGEVVEVVEKEWDYIT